jgi:xanthine dehydrogenase accessory factor
MMPAAMSRRAQALAAQSEAFATATVVRAQRPTSAKTGDVALVLADGTIEGFVGGACVEHSVRAHALQAIESGDAVLLKVLSVDDDEAGSGGREVAGEDTGSCGREVAGEEGAVTVQNPCLSGGALEIFLEPSLPAPRILAEGDTPIVRALERLGPELGLEVVRVVADDFVPRGGDLALVVGSHGRDELPALRRGLEAGLPYVGLVASRTRSAGVLGELRSDGMAPELLARIDTPAGLDIGARTPEEIALSILAGIVAVRRAAPSPTVAAPSPTAVDPICGMTVAPVASTPSLEHDGKTVYFCCEGCKATFEGRHEHAAAE